ncbi:MAG: hypothetical protein K6G11_01260, partial [Lachnospiraceae bacterium]|nr:hypothetical protein [Lachnospiraceae bacterium]
TDGEYTYDITILMVYGLGYVEGAESNDTILLKNLISELREKGLDVPENLTDESYTWGYYGNTLESINWNSIGTIDEITLPEFKRLSSFMLYYGEVDKLDISKCNALEYVDVGGSQLKELNISGLTNLNYFNCSDNNLKELDLRGLTNLNLVYCNANSIEKIYIDKGMKEKMETFFYDEGVEIVEE